MPNLCQLYNLSSVYSDCIDNAGVQMVRVIKSNDIDFEKLNNNLSFYFNKNTYEFIRSLPLKLNKTWGTLKSDYDGIKRQSRGFQDKPYFDFSLDSMRFRGYLSADKMAQIKKVNQLIVASKLLNGNIIIDGIEYDYKKDKIVISTLIPPYFKDISEDTNTLGDDIGINTIMSIEGRQMQKGFKGLFEWESMQNAYDYGIYVADNLFAFITDDNTLFTFN